MTAPSFSRLSANLVTMHHTALETSFQHLADTLRQKCQPSEAFTLQLVGEESQFLRFNRAKVRQTGCVTDCNVTLTLMSNGRSASISFPLEGDRDVDRAELIQALSHLRQDLPQLPTDPYLVLPSGEAQSHETHPGTLLAPEQVAETVLAPASGLDMAGIYASGRQLRGYADSAGQQHWFLTDTFILDYSLYAEDGQAAKGLFAGSHWQDDAYAENLATAKHQLEQLARPPKAVPKGTYRAYLAPAAVAEMIDMFSWGALSEASMQQGGSALARMRTEGVTLSPLFTLQENFGRGAVPRFNDLGEMAPVQLPLIQNGQLVNTLVSSRSAKEYGKTANGADESEGLRSPELLPGTLEPANILSDLHTGLYLSNLHYLNWSDRPNGRITGMTRYACFWVENGEIVAPIENLRFDESLYRCFGDRLQNLTTTQQFIPETGTYGHRNLGGLWLPGALINDFTFTL